MLSQLPLELVDAIANLVCNVEMLLSSEMLLTIVPAAAT
jgi:hypothetical protein